MTTPEIEQIRKERMLLEKKNRYMQAVVEEQMRKILSDIEETKTNLKNILGK